MPRPISTYRFQIRAGFDLDAAADVVPYLRDLGVDTAYLSPLLQATSGSDHGYDVVDVTRVDPARGGAAGLDRFATAARAAGLGILIDIVPNHMGVSNPRENAAWWDVLRLGRESEFAAWFDVDWAFGDGRIAVPVLGQGFDEAVDAGEITLDPEPSADAPSGLLRYFDHAFPLAPGSLDDAGPSTSSSKGPEAWAADEIRAVHGRQNFRLMFWRDEATELNYRRFFAVTTLAGVRVERPEVFDGTHEEILRWVREGLADGLRVDHPDGLRDPGAYLERLDAALRDALAAREAEVPEPVEGTGRPEPYVLVEKILEHGEQLPSWWATAGTTGYDALTEFSHVLTDRGGLEVLGALDARLREETGVGTPAGWTPMIFETKRMIADTIQVAEIARLVRGLPDGLRDRFGAEVLHDALAALLTVFPVYRSYLPAGIAHLEFAVSTASGWWPELAEAIAALVPVLTDTDSDVAWRFQQTTGPVMAKGVEDTAFYRYTRLGSLTEVGGDPEWFPFDGDPLGAFAEAQAARQASWPHAMTTLSTHDTKRGEDVRARLTVLAEVPERWADALDGFRAVASTGHGPFDNLLWQAIVGSWPLRQAQGPEAQAQGPEAPAQGPRAPAQGPEAPAQGPYAERLHAYAEKAAREAAEATGWWDPDEAFEARMHAVVDAAVSGAARPLVEAFVAEIAPDGWSNGLSQKLLQLTAPGVPDVYQGSELWELSLVDPDNRRPVDFALRRRLLAEIDAGALPPIDETGAAKLLVTSRALRLRRDRPELFTRFTRIEAVGAASEHVVAFDRGGAIAVATRLPHALERDGGWRGTALLLPPGAWRDELTGREFEASEVALSDLLATYPVALLRKDA